MLFLIHQINDSLSNYQKSQVSLSLNQMVIEKLFCISIRYLCSVHSWVGYIPCTVYYGVDNTVGNVKYSV